MKMMKIYFYCFLVGLFMVTNVSRAEMIEPLKTARIVKISGEIIFIDAGINEGVRPGDRFDILRKLADGSIENSGTISVTQVFEKSSAALAVVLYPGRIPGINDMLFERRDISFNAVPPVRTGRPLIRSKQVRASEDNLNIVVGAEIESGAGIYQAYCVYRYAANTEWRGMALTREEGSESFFWGMIPGFELKEGTIEYYIIAVDTEDMLAYSGSRDNPHRALIYLAEPYYADQADAVRASGTREKRGEKFPWIIIPGAVQIRNGQTLKGISLLGLGTAALATGAVVGPEKAMYYSAAGFVYMFNLADVLLSE